VLTEIPVSMDFARAWGSPFRVFPAHPSDRHAEFTLVEPASPV